MGDRLGPEPAAEMSLLSFRRGGDAQPSPSHQPQQLHVPSMESPDQSSPAGGVLQRLISRFTGYGGLDSQRLQLSITTAQRDVGSGAQSREADGQQAHIGAAVDGTEGGQAQQAAELPGEAGEGRAAEAAERHRLSTSVLDIRQLASSIESGLPFAVLLGILFVYRHAVGGRIDCGRDVAPCCNRVSWKGWTPNI
jgi:hypothetical protein